MRGTASAIAAAFAMASRAGMFATNMVPTVTTRKHRAAQRWWSSGLLAPFASPEHEARHERRVARWHNSPRTDKRAGPPGHLRR